MPVALLLGPEEARKVRPLEKSRQVVVNSTARPAQVVCGWKFPKGSQLRTRRFEAVLLQEATRARSFDVPCSSSSKARTTLTVGILGTKVHAL